jgi:hypothetical protein
LCRPGRWPGHIYGVLAPCPEHCRLLALEQPAHPAVPRRPFKALKLHAAQSPIGMHLSEAAALEPPRPSPRDQVLQPCPRFRPTAMRRPPSSSAGSLVHTISTPPQACTDMACAMGGAPAQQAMTCCSCLPVAARDRKLVLAQWASALPCGLGRTLRYHFSSSIYTRKKQLERSWPRAGGSRRLTVRAWRAQQCHGLAPRYGTALGERGWVIDANMAAPASVRPARPSWR